MEVSEADARVNLRQALLGIAQAIDAVELEAPYHIELFLWLLPNVTVPPSYGSIFLKLDCSPVM